MSGNEKQPAKKKQKVGTSSNGDAVASFDFSVFPQELQAGLQALAAHLAQNYVSAEHLEKNYVTVAYLEKNYVKKEEFLKLKDGLDFVQMQFQSLVEARERHARYMMEEEPDERS